MDKNLLTMDQAAKYLFITRQAVYLAMKNKKLKGRKIGRRWYLHIKDLEEYKSFKYSREKATFNGELIFDKKKGLYSPVQLAKHLGVETQAVYHKLRDNLIKHKRIGSMYVIDIKDIADWMVKKKRFAPISDWK